MGDSKKSGKLITINMKNFGNNAKVNDLPGGNDVLRLQETFRLFNADVDDVYTNLTKDNLNTLLAKIQKTDFTDYQYIAVAILTHGSRQGMLLSSDASHINLDINVISPILKNRSLQNKPKLFIVDACKGDFDFITANADATPYTDQNMNPTNTLRCYATSEMFAAYYTEDGSLFTTEFCRLLQEQGNDTPVLKIMKSTTKAVRELCSRRELKCTQVPSYETNMTEEEENNFILGNYM